MCGGYGCATGAKGSSRAALLDQAVATGRCEIRPEAMVRRLVSDAKGRVISAEYLTANCKPHQVDAKVFVVACQAIESARLLLLSTGPKNPQVLANGSGLVGRNLLFAGGGAGSGRLKFGASRSSAGWSPTSARASTSRSRLSATGCRSTTAGSRWTHR